ncbi:RNA degradosome polyphosphate kinase [Nocardioides caldifontis]|uniref:RNA degradosome polyphosphate kinase n=1 Tax=Nocardioides caldifontis TaxID=2588938 RepID=UPI0011DF3523|nr:RNA degradosome polyphosphate kinase [Nocardioides caldifontis]
MDDAVDGPALDTAVEELVAPVTDTYDVDPEYDVSSGELPDDRFLDRELSWLRFNQRVLELAEDEDVPLLERVRFAAIFASNLDEFFMVRVAGLKRRIAAGVAVPGASRLQPRAVLEQIWSTTTVLMQRHAALFKDVLCPALAKEEIHVLRWADLAKDEQRRMKKLFKERIYPVLTPLAVDPAHPFPYISGLSLNLAVVVRNPSTGKEHFARVKVPPILERFIEVDAQRFVPLEDVIAAHLKPLFPGMHVTAVHTFRVTRNEDLEVEEDDAENLLTALETSLQRRRFGPPVRLEVEETMDTVVLEMLVNELGVHQAEVVRMPGPLDLRGLNDIADLDRAELKYPSFLPSTHPHLAEVESASPVDVFSSVRRRDVLLHHPYDSFSTSVQRFLEQAAADPSVLAIKQTLYRTSGDSPIIEALIDAAEAGKQVLVIVEIKARFDEGANIKWARKLEHAGCHVVYGLVGLKTHCKLSLVVRQEADGIRRYVHLGTGNYNPKTARMYEDLGILTTEERIAEDVGHLFNNLSGYARDPSYECLMVAPHSVRDGLVERIEREASYGDKGRIRIKVNALVDEAVTDALYRASRNGCRVQLLTRSICALRPGVPGLSETIEVRSVLGRFLEHSRIFWFDNDGDPEVWIGSADLMHRNLDRRVEVLVPVLAEHAVRELDRMLDTAFDPGTAAWHLGQDGVWTRKHLDEQGRPLVELQEWLIRYSTSRRRSLVT